MVAEYRKKPTTDAGFSPAECSDRTANSFPTHPTMNENQNTTTDHHPQ
jgi:hypothetical protein